jgi:ubiquinol-cytochrome c reductase cytochrome b subunit
MVKKITDWLDDRTGYRRALAVALEEPVPGGASFAYVFGSVLTFLLVLQMVTGVLLALYYSPSASDAWGSVAYINDTVTMGWFVRGLHSHGASAMVLVAGLHMFQTALYGAYKKPRELNWIIGVLMLGLILAFALTGYLLPWDQTGYWATKVATGIAGTTPVFGQEVQALVQGGNEYGNLTLTRFFAIHVFILPGAMILLLVGHIALFRRHGVTPHWWLSKQKLAGRTQPFWPDQLFRDVMAMAMAFAALVAVNIATRGVSLDGPADPSSNFDARPEWYFRALFQALKYFEGPMEHVVALGAQVVIGGVLIALPFLDRGESHCPKRRWPYLGVLGLGAGILALLTVLSFREDAGNQELKERLAGSHEDGLRARALAAEHGVPVSGALSLVHGPAGPIAEGKLIFDRECAACHLGGERKGPELTYGYNSRQWIRDFLLDPGGERFFGPTEASSMPAVSLEGADLDAAVEFIYGESGADDVDRALAERGKALFEEGDDSRDEDPWDCSTCHPRVDYENDAAGGPNLARRGSVDMLAEFIGRASHPRWFGSGSKMPPFYDEYDRQQRRKVARYLVWLRSAEPGARP